jgi:hypothetical protein
MLYIALGAAILWFLVGLGRGSTVFRPRDWRILSGFFSIVCFAGGAYALMRGGWAIGAVLGVLGLWTVTTSRMNAPRGAAPPPPPTPSEMSLKEARSILGVGPDATRKEIEAAYKRLMRMAHPDKGGTTGLATQLNAAKERLLSE